MAPPENAKKHASPGLHLYTCNRLDPLADAAADIAARPLSSPLCAETIVVPNRGMERWLSMQLGARLGIWANSRYLFPNALVASLSKAVFPELPDPSPWSPDLLTWRIMELLSTPLLQEPAFSALSRYCADARPIKRHQLASKIADTFDQYSIFRPDLLMEWERGADGGWQAALWRRLIAQCSVPNRARLWKNLIELPQTLLAPHLPERIVAFGLSSLPPYHLSILEAAARTVPVHLFVMNPCSEFWDDIVSEREEARRAGRSASKNASSAPFESLHFERGNPLLAALGGYGRDFLSLLHEGSAEEHFTEVEPGYATLLTAVQSDIVRLIDRGGSSAHPPLPLAAGDRSLQVHSCHGPLREIEVVYDYLLDLFAASEDLSPSDILVMTPDIRSYAPFITAVFDAPEEERLRIPYAIADLSFAADGTLARAITALVALPGGRFGANEVFTLLEIPEIRACFAIEEPDLATLRAWTRACAIRWGLDESSWTARGLPASGVNTWKAGLDRLLAGYALASNNAGLFGDLLPYDGIEGSEALLAGKFAAFIGAIEDFTARSNGMHTLREWSTLLLAALDTFISIPAEKTNELFLLRSVLDELSLPARSDIPDQSIDRETVAALLADRLANLPSPSPFPGSGVTFSALMPMRSIPFKVICCVGMNDASFPRTTFLPSWNLIAAHPRKGDRSLEREDRYLFLEALLSARERLFISFCGQSVRDNRDAVPSVVVQELLACIDKGFFFDDVNVTEDRTTKKARDFVLVRHRLQPWSRAYFTGDDRLFTYSKTNRQAAAAFASKRFNAAIHEFRTQTLLPLRDGHGNIPLDSLIAFLKHPARFFCERRLGMVLDSHEEALEENECFTLTGLEKYRLSQELVGRFLDRGTSQEAFRRFSAEGSLPHGAIGDSQFDALAAEARHFAESIAPCISRESAKPDIGIDMPVGSFRITGVINGNFDVGHIRYRYSANTLPDLLALWVEHCALNIRSPMPSFFFGKDERWQFDPPTDPQGDLRRIIELYHEGLTRPLCFFPKTSFEYADHVIRKELEAKTAFDRALESWRGSDYAPGEQEDPWNWFCFKDHLAHDEYFIRPALTVWKALFNCLRKGEL